MLIVTTTGNIPLEQLTPGHRSFRVIEWTEDGPSCAPSTLENGEVGSDTLTIESIHVPAGAMVPTPEGEWIYPKSGDTIQAWRVDGGTPCALTIDPVRTITEWPQVRGEFMGRGSDYFLAWRM